MYSVRPEQVETDLHKIYQDAQNRLRVQKIDLLLAILPDKNGNLYGNISYSKLCFFPDYHIYVMPDYSEQQVISKGSARQRLVSCRSVAWIKMFKVQVLRTLLMLLLRSMPRLISTRSLTNLLSNMILIYSLSLQFGGRNLEFANPKESLPVVSIEPTIIFGADVTHPAALDDTAPSIASVSSFLFTIGIVSSHYINTFCLVPCRLLPPKTGPMWLTIMALPVHKVTVKSSSMAWKTLSSTIIVISEI